MKLFTAQIAGMYRRYTRYLGAMIMVALMTTSAAMSIPRLDLLSTDGFAILAGASITGIPAVTMTGNVGLSPAAGSYITGFDASRVSGTLYVVSTGPAGSVINSTLLQTAKSDLTTAYNDAAGRTPVPTGPYLNPGGGNIGGLNLTAGLYKFTSSAAITGADLTLTGSYTDVWIFQIGTSLNLGSGIHIILAGGAQAANIFWQVGSSATLGTYSVFKGSILADQSVTLATGATMDGRALAFGASVTMGSGVTVTKPELLFPIFSVNPSLLAFGNVDIGTSKTDSVLVTNTGTADLIITTITSSNTLFTVTPTSGTITPSSTRKIYVSFAPLSAGSQNGKIYFNHNADNAKDSISISGTGATTAFPIFSVTPLSLNFGNVISGLNKGDSVTVTNTGTANLIISSVTGSNAIFTTNPTSGTLTPGSSQNFYVTFAPLIDGLQTGKIYFNHNAANLKDSVTLTGTGISPIFSINPIFTNLNFGNVRNGTTKRDSVTVTNTGTADLIFSSVTSSNVLFTETPTTGTLTPGSSMKFYVTFSPLTDGLQNGKIYFNHNASNLRDSISVTGSGVSPIFSINPIFRNMNFGNVRNGTSMMDSVTVTNTGTADLIFSSVISSNVLFTATPTNGTLTPGSSIKFYITFAPLTDGVKNGTIIFTHNADNLRDTITVTGTGVSSKFSINPSFRNMNFGNVRNKTSKMDSLTVTNTGTADLIFSSVISSNVLFTATPTIGTLTPGSSMNFYITFAPLTDGVKNGIIIFNHNADNPKDTINVTGTGVSSKFTLDPSFRNMNFGNVRNKTSKMDSITVTNTGTADLIFSNVISSNVLFTATPTIGTLTPGSSMKFYFTFAPLTDGVKNGFIIFNHNADIPIDTITVTGTGVSSKFTLDPSFRNIDFGKVRNGLNKMISITVTNTGTADLIFSSAISSNALFTVTPTIGTLIPGSSLIFNITFSPLTDGVKNGIIIFNHNADNPIDTITVAGTGVSPIFSVSPLSLNFGDQRNGTSKMQFVTVKNTGTSDLTISGVTSSNILFTVTPSNVILPPGSSQNYNITFSPLIDGLQKGYIYFNHDADNKSDSISVSGTGVAPLFSASPRSLDFGNVRVGTTKKDLITVTNVGTADLIISSVIIANPRFTVTPTNGTIKPGASMNFIVIYTPVKEEIDMEFIYFNHNADKPQDSIFVRVLGVAPRFAGNPPFLNFGNVNTGSSEMDSITVQNIGTSDLVISSVTSSNSLFIVTPTNETIVPGDRKKFYITFSPLGDGLQNSFIYFKHNADNKEDFIKVSGTGITPIFSINPLFRNIDFGYVRTGSSKMDSVTVTNTGSGDLIFSNVTSTNSQFSVYPATGLIPSGSTLKFYIKFSPYSDGLKEGNILFYHNAANKLDAITVSGTGISSEFTFDPPSSRYLDFGTVFIGNSKQKSIIVKNTGTGNLVITDIKSSNLQYSATPVNTTIIAPGASQVYLISFAPTLVGKTDALILFTYNSGKDTIFVTGRGLNYLPIITIKEARKLPIGTEFAVEGIVTRTLGSYTRFQDSTAGLTILQTSGLFFNEVGNSDIQMADMIRVQGRISEIGFLKVINGNDLVSYKILSSLNEFPTPTKVILSELAINGEQYESRLITLENLSIAGDNDITFKEEKTYQVIDASDNSNKVVIRIGKNADTHMDGMPFLSSKVTFVGVLSQSSVSNPAAGYQLTPILTTDLISMSGVLDPVNTSQNSLSDNYPNPFNSFTTFQYSLGNADFVTLKVFNVLGNEVATLVNGFYNAGTYNVSFSAEAGSLSLSNGIYYCRMEVGTFISTKQMILVK